MKKYLIRKSKNPDMYMSSHNERNINTAARFNEQEKRIHDSTIRRWGYNWMTFDENGKLVVVE